MKKYMLLIVLLVPIFAFAPQLLPNRDHQEERYEPFFLPGLLGRVETHIELTSARFTDQGARIEGEYLEGEELVELLETLGVSLPVVPDGVFTFQLELLDSGEAPILATVSEGGTFSFPAMAFEEAGLFTYRISQKEATGWEMDKGYFYVVVEVIADTDSSQLLGEVSYEKTPIFINTVRFDLSEQINAALLDRWEESESEPFQLTTPPVAAPSIPENYAVMLYQNDALSYLALVNRHFRLSSGFSPEDLSALHVASINGTHHMRYTAARAAEDLFASASEAGHTLWATSGYRSYMTQHHTHNHWISVHGETEARRISARPGHSEHQLGLALDITTPSLGGLSTAFSSTSEGTWVRYNAHHYGFIVRYPQNREADTGFIYEPWHIRFVGVDAATAIFNSGQILEEFLGR